MLTPEQAEEVRAKAVERLNYAGERSDALLIEIRDWRRTYPFELHAVIDDDQLGWKAVLEIKSEPPLLRWGIAAGECMYHLRSALNTSLTSLVRMDGLTLRRPGQLQFPFATSHATWKGSAKRTGEGARIKELPAEVQRLIYSVQPFVQESMFGIGPGEDWMTPLFRMDNQGKHITELVAEPGESEYAGSYHAVLRNAPPGLRPAFPRTTHRPRWEDGAVFVEERTAPYAVLTARATVDWLLGINVVGENGHQVSIDEQIVTLHNHVALTINFMIDVWAGTLTLERLPNAGDPDFAAYVRPIETTAFARPSTESSLGGDDLWPIDKRLWAPHLPSTGE